MAIDAQRIAWYVTQLRLLERTRILSRFLRIIAEECEELEGLDPSLGPELLRVLEGVNASAEAAVAIVELVDNRLSALAEEHGD